MNDTAIVNVRASKIHDTPNAYASPKLGAIVFLCTAK
jgi:hypothetical protein